MAQADLTTVRGTCAPRFELVRQEFERNFAERGESVGVTGRFPAAWQHLSDVLIVEERRLLPIPFCHEG